MCVQGNGNEQEHNIEEGSRKSKGKGEGEGRGEGGGQGVDENVGSLCKSAEFRENPTSPELVFCSAGAIAMCRPAPGFKGVTRRLVAEGLSPPQGISTDIFCTLQSSFRNVSFFRLSDSPIEF